MKKLWKRLLMLLAVMIAAAGAAKFLYDDYYTLKEADLILFMGQSNMSGAGGNAKEAPELIKGAGYEYRAISQPEELCVLAEPFGENENRKGYLDDRGLIPRNGSLVTSFVNAYYEQTGERVVAVSASRGSARISSFNDYLLEDVIQRLENAKRVMNEKKVNIRHIYMVWLQGETDAYLEIRKEEYIGEMQKMLFTLQPYGVEKCFVIQIGNGICDGVAFDCTEMQKTQEQLCETDENFVLVSTLGKSLSEPPYMEDGIHFTQQALNILGEDAGTNAGKYVQALTEGR